MIRLAVLAALVFAAPPVLSGCGRAKEDVEVTDGGLTCTMSSGTTTCPDPPPHYADVQAIITLRCVNCHSGDPGGPWPLTTYVDVADWASLVRADVEGCSMPPADGGTPLMTDAERTALLTWLSCGNLQ